MIQVPITPRPNWKMLADEFGFRFHTLEGEPYWVEDRYFQFSLQQIESELEAPTAELHQMSLEAVDKVIRDEALLKKFQIPENMWDLIASSWKQKAPSLYGRLDFAYDGRHPAKLLEFNSDTPTSLYEASFWQWLWLEDQVNAGKLPRRADQYNLIQELMIQRMAALGSYQPGQTLHFACCRDSVEDRDTVQYLEDCAREAGLKIAFVYVEDIGINQDGEFTDLDDNPIRWMFKLYPWEFMFREEYAAYLHTANVNWLEPMWKSISSNKAILPLMWEMFPHHPNLLPAYFSDDPKAASLTDFVKKPIFSREGANISVHRAGEILQHEPGPYGDEGYIVQQYTHLPRFGNNHMLIGSWLINDEPAGLTIREDTGYITKDTSMFIPHIILD
ncbi:glutathionylspermidine synthase family protein [Photobacterium sp. WH77]|uniref:Glutathionylspermidine synthase family protein n=1 Tax=Photobacterium arenosum TaxID=2774143 RepID=A0ABR9BPU0_9GAMM|nr:MULTISPECIES: glutathionylspermidine synthase family protein [Photobacterium]MBD8514591.1 glutathionylspermidine synthase family protein [Photobacterium arenosum]MBV7264224.1 glutathionylspermidine synthase family protein [Photobacterium sp. WH24]MCG2838119.1 glutathionylspermidine synthase family protein [Photobacterium sp. WH77]MCG2845737.1 glutathionylspermidine synthase family protein [Photobacterium sp. WH80]MDO6581548.1 glutathionylspermidine synthase family protein [Photobacterium sp